MGLKKTSLSELAYRKLLRLVLDGSLVVGERLGEEQLAQKFGISRTPIREALRRLSAEGLATALPRYGFRICCPSAEEVVALFDCRARIESLALELAWGRMPVTRLQELQWALDESERTGDRTSALAVDVAMHELVAEFCTNLPLAEILRGLILRTAPFRNLRGFQAESTGLFQERREVIQALSGASLQLAKVRLEAHIRRGAESMVFNAEAK